MYLEDPINHLNLITFCLYPQIIYIILSENENENKRVCY